jgi:hypothetical protein
MKSIGVRFPRAPVHDPGDAVEPTAAATETQRAADDGEEHYSCIGYFALRQPASGG